MEEKKGSAIPKKRYYKGISKLIREALYPEDLKKNKNGYLNLLEALLDLTGSGETIKSTIATSSNDTPYGRRRKINWVEPSNLLLMAMLNLQDDANIRRGLKYLEDQGFIIRMIHTYSTPQGPRSVRKICVIPEKVYGTQMQQEIAGEGMNTIICNQAGLPDHDYYPRIIQKLRASPPFIFPNRQEEDFRAWCGESYGDIEKECWELVHQKYVKWFIKEGL